MHIKDHATAQGWFRKHAAAPSSVGSWKAFVARNQKVSEPRNMDQAALVDELEPGALKDEMKGNFDPSQETHEEYLQRINLERPFNAAHGGSAGQLVQNTADGSRPGYKGIGAGLSLDRFSEYKSAEKFFNKNIKNHKYLDKNKKHKNPYYKKNWEKLKTWQRTSITDNIYKTSLTMDKVPDGYVAVQQWATENKIPSFTKQSGSKIDRISAALQRGEDGKYRSDINYIKENLKPIKLRTSGGNVPGLGVGTVQDRWYIKVDKNSKKNILDFFDQRYLHSSTMNNINTFLDDKKLVKLLEKGNYKGIVARMASLPGSASVKSNALARISQMMSGTKFRAFDPDIKVNKVSANRIFKGLSETRWGNPFFPGFRRLVMDTIQKEIGGDYFNKKYSTFVTDARKALTKQFGKKFMETMHVNEITGMTSGFRGDTFNSTQFINLVNKDFNQIQHANMLRWYGEAETNVANALKNNNRYKANQIIKKWDTWAQNWYKDLPPEYKTKAVKNTIPTFKVGVDPVKNIFSPERLAEMKKVQFDPRGDYIANQKLQLAKTFKTQADTSLLKEVAAGDKKALERIKAQLIALCPKGSASGGRIGFANPAGLVDDGLICGKKRLERIMNGSKATKPEISILKKIGAGAATFLKGTLNPREWIRLKNWIGPQALAFYGGYEGTVAGYDHLEKGTPWKEALSNTLFGYLMKDPLEYQVEDPNLQKYLTPGAQNWATGIKLLSERNSLQNELEFMETGGGRVPKANTKALYYKRKEIEKLEDKFVKHMIDNNMSMESLLEPTSGLALEYQAGVTERDAIEMTRETPKEDRKWWKPDRESWYPGKWFDFLGDKTEGRFTGFSELKPKITHVPQYNLPPSIIGKKDFFANVPYYQGIPGQLPMGPISGRSTAPIKNYTPRTYQSIKESKRPSQLETLAQKKERFRRMMLEPGMLGTQDKFAGGGIASLMKKKW